MFKKFFLIILILLGSMSVMSLNPNTECKCRYQQEEWVEKYKDNSVCIFYQYKENRGVYFNVISDEDVDYKIEMYDVLGRKIIDKEIEFSTNFNKSDLNKGIYCLRILNKKNETSTTKIVVVQ